MVRGYIRVGERASLVEVEPAFRSETRTRRVYTYTSEEYTAEYRKLVDI